MFPVLVTALALAADLAAYCPPQVDKAYLLERRQPFIETGRLAPSGKDRLLTALARYRRVARAGGWPAVEEGEVLYLGDDDRRVKALREHLVLSGDLHSSRIDVARPGLFDEHVAAALGSYQARHGLAVTGTLTRETIAEMSVPVEERMRTMLLNIERMRWLEDFLPNGREVWVNIPSFEIWLYEGERRVDTMRAVVGTLRRQTPVMSDRIRYLEVNPSWLVPRSILWAQILPRAFEDPDWLNRAGYQLWARGKRVDPLEVDWEEVRETRSLPYMVRQRPGRWNAMGRVKFMFPNHHTVYLHDTPKRHLFERATRTYSFGCVRVERPLCLSRFLMQDLPQEKTSKIEGMIEGRGPWNTRRVDLPEPVPVHIVYFTSWVDQEGILHFREDVYGLDREMAAALDHRCLGWDEP